MKIDKYNDFILEKEFDLIFDNILLILESEGEWLDDKTYHWDLTNKETSKSKLEKFLSNLPKEKVRKFFYKFLDKIRLLPSKTRRRLLMIYSTVFLSIAPLSYLANKTPETEDFLTRNKELVYELEEINKESSFDEAQSLVKEVEKGYSSDRSDSGNWIKTKWGKRFVGTNHGISAPVLMEYLGRIPTKEDMKNLTYEEALEIYKKEYWNPQNLNLFNNQSIANILYDGCVNQGVGAMKEILRNSLKEEGVKIGSLENPFKENWIKEANSLDPESLFESIKRGREKKYKESKTFKKHGVGWLKRLNSIYF